MPKISHSDIKTFKRCRRKWDWKSRLRRHLRPKEVIPAFYLGSGVHHALEVYYLNGDDPVEAIRKWCWDRINELKEDYHEIGPEKEEELTEQAKLGVAMMEHYKSWAQENDQRYFEEVVETELEGSVEIPGTDGEFQFILDGLVKDSTGLYWVLEHKTAKRIRTDHLPMDEQIVKYIWAAQRELDIDITGVIYTIIKKSSPQPPNRLKSGGFSKAKKSKVTYEKYKQTLLEEFGEIPEEYEEILDYYKKRDEKENPFVWRKAIARSDKEVQEAGDRVIEEYKDMIENPRIYPNPTRDCKWDCSFQDACELKSMGADYEAELEKNFVCKSD